MSSESTHAIDTAIQSAESLFASLLDRASSIDHAHSSPDHAHSNPEASLLPGQRSMSPEGSIVSVGVASLDPAHLMAASHAVYEILDPRESLSAIASRRSLASLSETTSYQGLKELLVEKERDLELAAAIGQMLLKRNDLLDKDIGVLEDTRQALEQQVSQLTHSQSQKEELLRLYVKDARERDQAEAEVVDDKPEWVVALTDECRELRDSNAALKVEADQLRRETADIETKERELVQACLDQFSEAKRSLVDMRERSEESYLENQALTVQLEELNTLYEQDQLRKQQLTDEGDVLKDQLVEAQETISHLTNEVSDLQEQFNMTSVLLKEANDEVTALKDISLQLSGSPGDPGNDEGQHESIVKEIEEALRKEIAAASMLSERPRSPNHYAQQRTMVVMETVRAATLATARRLERLATEAKLKDLTGGGDSQFRPVASSSPNDQRSRIPRPSPLTRSTPSRTTPLTRATPSSPIPSDEEASISSLPEDLVRYRSPQKLQIVKPMEGSMTLLKWKLLATPQLGGATSFFADQTGPGVHLKKWSASQIRDSQSNIEITRKPYDTRMTMSAMDLRELNSTYPPASVRRPKTTTTTTRRRAPPPDQPAQSQSLLGQFGSFLGSGLSRLKFKGVEESTAPPTQTVEHSDSAGLGGLL